MPPLRAALIWVAIVTAILVPMVLAAMSPFLAWRPTIYSAAGFAGIAAMALLLIQPLLAAGRLPMISTRRGRHIHRALGLLLVSLVVAHVGGLWLTSAPDVIDALLFNSPTPFSSWGVVAMWAVFATALLVVLRERRHVGMRLWRLGHTGLAFVIVVGSAVHALLVEGAMEPWSKAVLCLLAFGATMTVVLDQRIWVMMKRRGDDKAQSRETLALSRQTGE